MPFKLLFFDNVRVSLKTGSAVPDLVPRYYVLDMMDPWKFMSIPTKQYTINLY